LSVYLTDACRFGVSLLFATGSSKHLETVTAADLVDVLTPTLFLSRSSRAATLRRLERFWIRTADLVQRPQPLTPDVSPPAQPLFA
jgi:hypothetical protein